MALMVGEESLRMVKHGKHLYERVFRSHVYRRGEGGYFCNLRQLLDFSLIIDTRTLHTTDTGHYSKNNWHFLTKIIYILINLHRYSYPTEIDVIFATDCRHRRKTT